MEWSSEQEQALKAVSDWFHNSGPQVFRLFGYAGTGKTTLARHFAENIDGTVLFGAFTGKAAQVLRNKGCPDATTIHSMIYRHRESDDEDDTPIFSLNRSSPIKSADLVIIDECSMVDEDLGRDLLSFHTKILVLGDPAQLPPISGAGFFTDVDPDFLLSEIHRQAADSPIITIAQTAREGKSLSPGQYGDCAIVRRNDIHSDDVLMADQVIVGMNKTRRRYNERLRELLSFQNDMPMIGDRLVCLRNNMKKGLLNGSLWSVDKTKSGSSKFLRMNISSNDTAGLRAKVRVLPQFFHGSEQSLPAALRRESDAFDYGYALTAHKAQGSQWDYVYVFDESWAFKEDRYRWLYTAITRAAKKVTIVI